MKAHKDARGRNGFPEAGEAAKKAVKLAPIKKSGKDKFALYSSLDEEDDLVELEYRKRESVLDYFDDGEEDPAHETDWEEDEFDPNDDPDYLDLGEEDL